MGAYIKENWLFVVVAVYLVSMVLYGITADSSAWQSQPFPWCCRWGWFILVRRLSRICFAAMRWSIRRWRTA